ncbi:hypothetical protein J437_LFUL013720 [Ladona fulva]|uniref:Uncharacterized protein n=1 Tax=Ladona fulva TaxID=123851 RepID=A0A8K0P6H2_LADFU|nr:hypothetical protein J437_LFUL013720 [Ladona fulva]
MAATDDDIEASAIVTEPPENATAPVFDEDSGGTIINLPGSLLRAPPYLVLDDSDPDDPSFVPENDSPSDAVATTSIAH